MGLNLRQEKGSNVIKSTSSSKSLRKMVGFNAREEYSIEAGYFTISQKKKIGILKINCGEDVVTLIYGK